VETIVLDTNLLILLVVGQASRDYIVKHKCLKAFTCGDYDLLKTILSQASSIRFTPNTLTETSNLLKRIDEPARSDIFRKFADIINLFDESYIESRFGARQTEFVRLGLTDSILLLLSDNPSLVLVTADFGLYLAATGRGLNVVNFNHHREANSS
jgi:hypothetical protein